MSNLVTETLHPSSNSSNKYILTLSILFHTSISILYTKVDISKFINGVLIYRKIFLGKSVLATTGYYTLLKIVPHFNGMTKGRVIAKTVNMSEAEFKGVLGQILEKRKVKIYENMVLMTNDRYYEKEPLWESHKVKFVYFTLFLPCLSLYFNLNLISQSCCSSTIAMSTWLIFGLSRFWTKNQQHGMHLSPRPNNRQTYVGLN